MARPRALNERGPCEIRAQRHSHRDPANQGGGADREAGAVAVNGLIETSGRLEPVTVLYATIEIERCLSHNDPFLAQPTSLQCIEQVG